MRGGGGSQVKWFVAARIYSARCSVAKVGAAGKILFVLFIGKH